MHTSTGLLRPLAVFSSSVWGSIAQKTPPKGARERLANRASMDLGLTLILLLLYMARKCNSHEPPAANVVLERFGAEGCLGLPRFETISRALLVFRGVSLSRWKVFTTTSYQEEDFPALADGAVLGPIRSLRRRERFLASDR
jgi:hypothetical protein